MEYAMTIQIDGGKQWAGSEKFEHLWLQNFSRLRWWKHSSSSCMSSSQALIQNTCVLLNVGNEMDNNQNKYILETSLAFLPQWFCMRKIEWVCVWIDRKRGISLLSYIKKHSRINPDSLHLQTSHQKIDYSAGEGVWSCKSTPSPICSSVLNLVMCLCVDVYSSMRVDE